MKPCHLTVFCGGQSGEHEISLLSASNVVAALNASVYQVCVIFISKAGEWFVANNYLTASGASQLAQLQLKKDCSRVTPYMGDRKNPWIILETQEKIACDVVFPVLHGPLGEDGRFQGLLELLQLPYVGCDALSSAICMDKDFSKQLVLQKNIQTAPWIVVHQSDYELKAVKQAVDQLGYPCFVKPSNMGSSVGVSKVKTKAELQAALTLAFESDQKVLIEKYIQGREIECAVLGNGTPKASTPGEVVPLKEFYDYQSKYFDENGSKVIVPAILEAGIIQKIQEQALVIFKALGCSGLSRVDFFLTAAGDIYFNEINTIPGFTNISLYPKCWAYEGLGYAALIDELIRLAFQ